MLKLARSVCHLPPFGDFFQLFVPGIEGSKKLPDSAAFVAYIQDG